VRSRSCGVLCKTRNKVCKARTVAVVYVYVCRTRTRPQEPEYCSTSSFNDLLRTSKTLAMERLAQNRTSQRAQFRTLDNVSQISNDYRGKRSTV